MRPLIERPIRLDSISPCLSSPTIDNCAHVYARPVGSSIGAYEKTHCAARFPLSFCTRIMHGKTLMDRNGLLRAKVLRTVRKLGSDIEFGAISSRRAPRAAILDALRAERPRYRRRSDNGSLALRVFARSA